MQENLYLVLTDNKKESITRKLNNIDKSVNFVTIHFQAPYELLLEVYNEFKDNFNDEFNEDSLNNDKVNHDDVDDNVKMKRYITMKEYENLEYFDDQDINPEIIRSVYYKKKR